MKTNECPYDKAFKEFVRRSKLPKWKQWIHWRLHKPLFPVCIGVDDSREYENDGDADYLLTKHFLDIEKKDPGILLLTYFTTEEPEGILNEPCVQFDSLEDTGYQWPVRSLRHAWKMIPDFVRSVHRTPK